MAIVLLVGVFTGALIWEHVRKNFQFPVIPPKEQDEPEAKEPEVRTKQPPPKSKSKDWRDVN